jgi:hypothetical protein
MRKPDIAIGLPSCRRGFSSNAYGQSGRFAAVVVELDEPAELPLMLPLVLGAALPVVPDGEPGVAAALLSFG